MTDKFDRQQTSSSRRTFLKTATATGLAATGVAGFSGSGAAASHEQTLSGDQVDILQGNPNATFQNLTMTIEDIIDAGEGVVEFVGSITGQALPPSGNENAAKEIDTTFTDQLTSGDVTDANDSGLCDILFLDIGPIDLEVLGLVVNISQITVNVDALEDEGLLGDLLCALA